MRNGNVLGNSPHVVAMVFTAADSLFRISSYFWVEKKISGVTHNVVSLIVPQIVG